MKKIYKILKIILNIKFIWSKPKHSDILIYDANMVEYISPYITKYKSDIIHTRLEKIYVYILIKLLVKFSLKNLLLNYTKIFIELSKPKIIITATDNDINFYKLKMEVKSVKFKTIAIQNGHRTLTYPDILNYYKDFNESKFASDYVLCFFSELEKIYEKIIKCKSIAIGSFLNNINFEKKTYIDGKNIKNFFWISQYRHRPLNKNMFDEKSLSNNQKINLKNTTVMEQNNLEKKILPIIYMFCKEKNIKFNILSSYKKTDKSQTLIAEKNFYQKIINDPDWEVNENKKKHRTDAYKILLEEADIVAHSESTLGYELLARGIKTITITAKKSCYPDKFPQFSWPSKFDYKGPIWTNSDDENEILRLLNFIYSINNEDWNNYIFNVKDKIMQTDKDNKIFCELIEKLIKNDKI